MSKNPEADRLQGSIARFRAVLRSIDRNGLNVPPGTADRVHAASHEIDAIIGRLAIDHAGSNCGRPGHHVSRKFIMGPVAGRQTATPLADVLDGQVSRLRATLSKHRKCELAVPAGVEDQAVNAIEAAARWANTAETTPKADTE